MSSGRDFDNERERREWDAQERALRAERSGSADVGTADVAQYRLIARALRTPALDALPMDFAAQTAARARSEAHVANESFEVWLERGLVALLLVAGAAAIRAYGIEAWLGFSFSIAEGAAVGIRSVLSWSLAIAACIGISSVFAFAGKR
jgi:hypothetical protein